jgi:PAS domain S-box-containing protein
VAFCLYSDITEKLKKEVDIKLSDYTISNSLWGIVYFQEDGSMYNCNDAFAKIYGYDSIEDAMRSTVFDFGTASTQEEWKNYWNEIKILKNYKYNSKRRRKDGAIIDVEINPSYIKFGDLELACVFIYDISEKIKAEESLKNSIERFEYALLATSDVIWEYDLIKRQVFISKNFTTIFGHQFDDEWMPMENNLFLQNLHPSELEDVLNKQQALATDPNIKHWQGEYQLRKSDGSYANVLNRAFGIKDKNGILIKVVGAIQDISKRKEEEERLKLMDAVIMNANDSVLITEAEPMDGTGTKILFVNPAFERMTGYTKEEVIGKPPRIFQNEETDKKELNRLGKAMRNWETCEITVLNSRKNGEKFWVNFQIVPIANQKGWFTHWIAVERDVTKQIESNLEKEKLVKELIESNLELKQFSYITSHNLRAPLTNLVAVCGLLKTDKIADARTLKLIDSFKISTHRLNETLNDLIEILIIKENRSLQTSQIAFSDVLRKTKDSLSISLLENKVEVQADFSEAPSITFTNAYLESIFINLFTNAIKYRHTERAPVITIKSFLDLNGDTKLVFNDNGSGINMIHAKDKIFGLYKKFHSNADSKGIGLYLIHSQITALGGTIDVESELNIGTTFTITFK